MAELIPLEAPLQGRVRSAEELRGPQGLVGPEGPQGPEGPAGPEGPQGEQGEDAVLPADNVTGTGITHIAAVTEYPAVEDPDTLYVLVPA